jgi:opacity protein-like surface antigen
MVTFDAPPLVPGSKITAGLAFNHELGRTDAVGAGYQFQRMIVEDEHSNTQTLDTRWTHTFGTGAHARIRAGATRFTAPAASRTTAVGGAGVDARWGRHALDAQLDRYVDLAYGLGRVRINELVSARYSLLLTSDLGFELRGVQGWGRDPGDASFALTTTDVLAGLRYAFSRNLALAGSYTFRRISEAPFLPVSSQGAALFLSYRQAWP